MWLITEAALQSEQHAVKRTVSVFIVMINIYAGYTKNTF